MKIAFIAAGAAHMYCGSCLRDNALARRLLRLGHDVLFVPLYTPLRVDRDPVPGPRVFYGGINIYLRTRWPFFRRLGTLARLLDSPSVLRLAARLGGMTQAADLGPLTVATVRGDEGELRGEAEALAHWLAEAYRPDLINLPNALLAGLARPLKAATGAAVVCTLSGEDLFLDQMVEPFKSQTLEILRARLRGVDRFIAISEHYAASAAELFGLPRSRIDVVPIGLDPSGFGRSGAPSGPFTIGYLARIDPAKGLHLLVEALAGLRATPETAEARLAAAGYLGPEHRSYWRRVQEEARRRGLEAAFQYHGELTFEGKLRFLDGVHVLSVPTVHPEPKGLFVLEALAHGVPVVMPRHGAFPELIERTGGGLLFEPGDAAGLADQLRRLALDPPLADHLSRQGRAAVLSRFTDEAMARRTLEVYEKCVARAGERPADLLGVGA